MEEKKPKSQSQRMRAVLFRVWEVDNRGFKDFEYFYQYEMERIITHYKNKYL